MVFLMVVHRLLEVAGMSSQYNKWSLAFDNNAKERLIVISIFHAQRRFATSFWPPQGQLEILVVVTQPELSENPRV